MGEAKNGHINAQRVSEDVTKALEKVHLSRGKASKQDIINEALEIGLEVLEKIEGVKDSAKKATEAEIRLKKNELEKRGDTNKEPKEKKESLNPEKRVPKVSS